MKITAKIFLMSFLGLLSVIQLHAQDRVITGTVIDASNGEALPGATIIIAGTTIGTTTDIEGKFTISASESNTTFCVLYRIRQGRNCNRHSD